MVEESLAGLGATIMGRNMFGGHPGPWDPQNPWNGWWGEDPPFHHPVFVLTHYARDPLELEGGTTFTFVTDGVESALEKAREAARRGGRGARRRRERRAAVPRAGLVDEMEIHLVPVFLGGGERLFEDTGTDLHDLELVRTVTAPNVTHLKLARR